MLGLIVELLLGKARKWDACRRNLGRSRLDGRGFGGATHVQILFDTGDTAVHDARIFFHPVEFRQSGRIFFLFYLVLDFFEPAVDRPDLLSHGFDLNPEVGGLATDILLLVFAGLAELFDQCFLTRQLTFYGGQPVIENDNIGTTGTTCYNDDAEKKIW